MINMRIASLRQVTEATDEVEAERLTLRHERYSLFCKRVQSVRCLLFQFIIQNSMHSWSPTVMETVILLTLSLEPGSICDEIY